MFPPVFTETDVFNDKNNVNSRYLIPIQQKPDTTKNGASNDTSNPTFVPLLSSEADLESYYSSETNDVMDTDADHQSWIEEEEPGKTERLSEKEHIEQESTRRTRPRQCSD